MTVLADHEILERCYSARMIEPFSTIQVGSPSISYGIGSYGYDIRAGLEFKVFTNVDSVVVDPKNFDEKIFVIREVKQGQAILIPPNSFALASSFEYIRVPRDILVLCLGKSTYARCGIVINVTPLEPEWEGNITMEISNTTPMPAKIYAGEGIAQLVFLKADKDCNVSYANRGGKYQYQRGVVGPRV